MTPVPIEGQTRDLGKPENWPEDIECLSLPIADTMVDGMPVMYSAWKPSEEEITALLMGGHVILGIHGQVHPVVQVFAGPPSDGE